MNTITTIATYLGYAIIPIIIGVMVLLRAWSKRMDEPKQSSGVDDYLVSSARSATEQARYPESIWQEQQGA